MEIRGTCSNTHKHRVPRNIRLPTSKQSLISPRRLLLPVAEAGFQLPVASLAVVLVSRWPVGGCSSASRRQAWSFFETVVSLLPLSKLSPLRSCTNSPAVVKHEHGFIFVSPLRCSFQLWWERVRSMSMIGYLLHWPMIWPIKRLQEAATANGNRNGGGTAQRGRPVNVGAVYSGRSRIISCVF